jgi:hypothetical protein
MIGKQSRLGAGATEKQGCYARSSEFNSTQLMFFGLKECTGPDETGPVLAPEAVRQRAGFTGVSR